MDEKLEDERSILTDIILQHDFRLLDQEVIEASKNVDELVNAFMARS